MNERKTTQKGTEKSQNLTYLENDHFKNRGCKKIIEKISAMRI